ncbi:MAG: hypothetical protein ACW99A_09735 [Candidatus Kariarchaeaceae archaeon]|jgi:hypothetical protein
MSVSELIPRFKVESYKNGIIPPALGWAIVQVLTFIFVYIDDDNFLSVSTRYGFIDFELVIYSHLLFGAWAGISVAKAGGSSGDGVIAGLVLASIAWILWVILFVNVDPADQFGNSDFRDDILPYLPYFMITHVIGAVTLTGITRSIDQAE